MPALLLWSTQCCREATLGVRLRQKNKKQKEKRFLPYSAACGRPPFPGLLARIRSWLTCGHGGHLLHSSLIGPPSGSSQGWKGEKPGASPLYNSSAFPPNWSVRFTFQRPQVVGFWCSVHNGGFMGLLHLGPHQKGLWICVLNISFGLSNLSSQAFMLYSFRSLWFVPYGFIFVLFFDLCF